MHAFVTAGRIVFGRGTAAQIGLLTAALGARALVVTGRSTSRADPVVRSLVDAGVTTTVFPVAGEPTVRVVQEGAAAARQHRADVVVGVGGGSAIDAAKAIAASSTNDSDLFEYLETIGRGQPLPHSAAPVVAVPTTAGTGSEVTKNAVLASPEHRVKVSLRHVSLFPRVAVIDPELARDLPRATTIATGLDALTQLIEPYVSPRHNPLVDGLVADGIRRAVRSLPVVARDGSDLGARADMALAALWSGMALANAALGAVHGLAGPIGGMFDAPHGAVCAALLPHVMAANVAAASRAGQHETLTRYEDVARLLTGRGSANALDGVDWVSRLVDELDVAGLGAYGVGFERIPEIIAAGRRASSMKGNPVTLSDPELTEILERSIDGRRRLPHPAP